MIFVFIIGSIAIFGASIAYLLWKKKKIEEIFRKMKFSGEAFLLGPEMASFRGATAKYGKVRNNGIIGLTYDKIIFIPLIGKKITIPVKEITDISETKTFLGHYRAGVTVLVLHGQEADIGFYVKDNLKWQNAIKGIIK